jgi:hypothetical protein
LSRRFPLPLSLLLLLLLELLLLFELGLELLLLLLFELLLGLGSLLRGDSLGGLGLSDRGLSGVGFRSSCACETVVADAPTKSAAAKVKTPRPLFLKLDFIRRLLCAFLWMTPRAGPGKSTGLCTWIIAPTNC